MANDNLSWNDTSKSLVLDGFDVATDVAANTSHRTSTGSSHSYINQSVVTTGTPTFKTLTLTQPSNAETLVIDSSATTTKVINITAVNTADYSFACINTAAQSGAATALFQNTNVGTDSPVIECDAAAGNVTLESNGDIDLNGNMDVSGNITIVGTVDGIDIATDVAANTAKNTNVSTSLSVGTVGINTVGITSDGGTDDVVLPAATVSAAGMLTTAKWGEIVANNAKVSNASHTGDVTGSTSLTITANAVDDTHIDWGTGANQVSADDIPDGSTNAIITLVQETKLDGIEASADVTDATNVNAAGATMNSDTTMSGNGYFLDEDTMSSNSATKISSQQSIKAYVDTQVATQIANVVEDTTPQLGGDLDLNQKNIILDPTPTSDHTWNGEVATFTAGEGVVIGDVCYLKSDGKFWQCDADAVATTAGMLAMATGTISADATGTFLLNGFIRDDTWALTVGAELYVDVTPGNPTETKPTATADIVRIVGYAYSADVVYFNVDKTYLELK